MDQETDGRIRRTVRMNGVNFNFSRLIGQVFFLVLALLVVACASTTITQTSPAKLSQQASPTVQTNTTSPIEQAAAAGAVTVHVTLVEFRILSSVTIFHVNTPYYFVITNRGQVIHEFKIMPDKPDGTPQPPDVQYKGTFLELEPIMPGTTWTVNYTFLASAVGRYEIACQMGKHYMAGMRLPIVVAS